MLLPSSGTNANDKFYIRPEGIHKNNLPAMQETWIPSLGWEDPLEEDMATHSSILVWRIPMDRGAWRAIVHGVTKSQTRLRDKTSTAQRGSIDNKNLRIIRYSHSTSHHRQSQHMLIKWSFLA